MNHRSNRRDVGKCASKQSRLIFGDPPPRAVQNIEILIAVLRPAFAHNRPQISRFPRARTLTSIPLIRWGNEKHTG